MIEFPQRESPKDQPLELPKGDDLHSLHRSQFLTKRFPMRLSPNRRELSDALHEAHCTLEATYSVGYFGLVLGGSRTNGYAHDKSDVDLVIVWDKSKLSQLKNTPTRNPGLHDFHDPFDTPPSRDIIQAALVKHGFAANIFVDYLSQHEHLGDALALVARGDPRAPGLVARYFGLSIGVKVDVARLQLVEAIGALVDSKMFWEEVQDAHFQLVLGPAHRCLHRRDISSVEKDMPWSRYMNALERDCGNKSALEIERHRYRKFRLPNFEDALDSLRRKVAQIRV